MLNWKHKGISTNKHMCGVRASSYVAILCLKFCLYCLYISFLFLFLLFRQFRWSNREKRPRAKTQGGINILVIVFVNYCCCCFFYCYYYFCCLCCCINPNKHAHKKTISLVSANIKPKWVRKKTQIPQRLKNAQWKCSLFWNFFKQSWRLARTNICDAMNVYKSVLSCVCAWNMEAFAHPANKTKFVLR